MWQRKTKKELKKVHRRRLIETLGMPLFLGILNAPVIFIVSLTTGGWWDPGPVSLAEAAVRAPTAFVVGFLVGCLIMVGELLTTGGMGVPWAYVCPKCGRTKGYTGSLDCPCGGHFEPMREWKWVEDDGEGADDSEKESPEQDDG